MNIGLQGGEDPADQTFNQTPQEMLRAVPGITAKNMSRITLEVGSILDVANLEEAELFEMVGKEAGRQVWRFFNRSVFEE